MRVNRGSTGGESSDQGDGAGGMRAPSGGGTQRQDADQLKSRTHRGNQNDEDAGSSASRGAADPDPTPDPTDVTGTTDALGG